MKTPRCKAGKALASVCRLVLLLATLVLVALLSACGSDSGDDDEGNNGLPPGTNGDSCPVCDGWEKCQVSACVFDPASQWYLAAVSGHVSEQNSLGDAWDALGGAPDPYVCVTVNGKRNCTSTAQDSFSPQWNEHVAENVGGGALMGGIYVEFMDEDISSNDFICTGNITVDEAYFDQGTFQITCDGGLGYVDFALDFVK
jgi:hypothetical protein